MYGGQEPRSNEVFVPARQATLAFGFHSLESIDGLHKRLELRAPRIMKSFWIRNELQGKKTTVMTTKKQFSWNTEYESRDFSAANANIFYFYMTHFAFVSYEMKMKIFLTIIL